MDKHQKKVHKMHECHEKMAKHMWKKEFHGQFKERKEAIRKTIREMKENAKTPEELAQVKTLKEQLKAELKEEKRQYKGWKGDKKEKGCRKNSRCDNDEDRFKARHVADVTIPDNSELPADTPVTKTWRLRNAGLLAWPADSQLIFVSHRGDNLNGPERVLVGTVEPNQEVEVSVTFITPAEPGRYIGYYRMATGDGAKFGQRVWVAFIVPNAAATPTAPALYPAVTTSSTTTTRAPDAADDVTMM